jgi:cyclophilin family peptidyl-prolyl cis-trans isomerase
MILVCVFLSVAPWASTGKDAPKAEPGPKRAEFEKVFAEWKSLLTELRQLRTEYQVAEPAGRKKNEIENRYKELVKKGIAMEGELTRAAEGAYAENPGADKQIELVLRSSVRGNVGMDNYEEALRIAELLIRNKCPDESLYNQAGIAACAVGKLDDAERYLEIAHEKRVLDGLGSRFHDEFSYLSKAWKKEREIRAAEAKADDLPRVLLKTSKGDIEIELLENEAPNTVANFISLVERGGYDGLAFHRVLPQFMAQGGCPKGDGTGGPGYEIPCECYEKNHRLHFRGSLSMAHAGRDTGGSQFFLTFVPTTFLDGKHTVFGRVIKGMDVLAKIQRRDPSKPPLPKADKIIEAKVLRKRPHEYVPKKT